MTDEEFAEIRQAFEGESAELLGDMEGALLALEAGIDNPDEFNRLFRTVHTIKGSAGIVGCEIVEQFCHSIEHILVRIREHEQALDHRLIALFLECHDHISTLIALFNKNPKTSLDAAINEIHLRLLDQLANRKRNAPSAPSYGQLDPSYLVGETENTSAPFGFFGETGEEGTKEESAAEVAVSSGLASEPASAVQGQRGVRIDAAKLDQLSNLVIELVTASSVLEAQVRYQGDQSITESTAHVANLVKQLQEKTMGFRMVPVQMLFRRFQRIVHDGGKALGKEIRFLVSGGETELDKAVAEKLYDPLLHLVRNAMDHGIEPSPERHAAGKPATGTVHLQAVHDSGNIVITVSDDGKGIDREHIARKALKLGMVKNEGMLGSQDVLNCIFEPGFSTLDSATTLSGRGVGLDVVKKAIESLRGRIFIETEPGLRTNFIISIPLSLSVVDGFMVSLGERLFILPMELVQETLELPDLSTPGTMTNGCLNVWGEPLPCLDLQEVLEIKDAGAGARHIVVTLYKGKKVGLIVDCLLGEVKAVIKPLGPVFRNARCVSGASILGDGSIALLLEMEQLLYHP